MKKTVNVFLLLFVMVTMMLYINVSAIADTALEEKTVIKIYTISDLMKIGNDPDWPLDGHYILMNDIIFARGETSNFEVIAPEMDSPFIGIFDGNNKTIEGLVYIDNNASIALFGSVGYSDGEYGIIKNLGLVDIEFQGKMVGGIVNVLRNGVIENCYTTGKIISQKDAAGIVRVLGNARIRNSYSTCYIEGAQIGGGIASTVAKFGEISGCYFKGTVSGIMYLGGIAGWNYGKIERSFFSGNVHCDNPNYYPNETDGVGGISGENSGVIVNSYSLGFVSGVSCVGGITGTNDGIIENCYSTSKLEASYGYNYIGGIAGINSSLLGYIDRCVSIVPEIVIDKDAGGRIMGTEGRNDMGNPINYAWDKMKLIRRNPSLYLLPFEKESMRNGQFKSLALLKEQDTYVELGWSFYGDNPIWEFADGHMFPKLVGVGGQDDLYTPTYIV